MYCPDVRTAAHAVCCYVDRAGTDRDAPQTTRAMRFGHVRSPGRTGRERERDIQGHFGAEGS
jgi:hypothetical protein